MNTIYQKLKPKRKYRKTPPCEVESNKEPEPLCGHMEGYCSYTTCRMNYAIKEQEKQVVKVKKIKVEYSPKLDDNIHTRTKEINRKREIELAKLDAEVDFTPNFTTSGNPYVYIGEFAKRKARTKKYKMILVRGLLILIGLGVAYPIVIAIMDLFY